MKIIHALSGPLAGNSYPLNASCVIGRDGDTDIQLLDEGVSRRHACVVENEDGSVSVLDLGSSNGTLIDGQRVAASKLATGEKLQIGGTTFEFREVDPDEVDTDVPDIKLTSGPALEATVAGDASDLLKQVRARLAAAEAAQNAAPTLCCASPLAAQARKEGWAHCPACGSATA